MSENIPESIPTSQDPRSRRPTKRRALGPTSKQAAHLDSLFANPNKPILLPSSSALSTAAPASAVPEIVSNVQGSSAGAGSGEFHVYKASRRREYERLRAMDEEKEKEEQDKEFMAKKEEWRSKDDEKTAKNRAKREKARLRALRKKEGGGAGGSGGSGDDSVDKAAPHKTKVQKFKPNENSRTNGRRATAAAAGSSEVHNPEEIGIVIHDDDD
ncbi:hypothetical protein AAFC00_004349 [Neodothiora populina]|uniref:DUF1168-domain-containing protein n=1 Tax=Neodothiora populina TaxID=2781224 RepID=A0ABR3PJN5_9PEZI